MIRSSLLTMPCPTFAVTVSLPSPLHVRSSFENMTASASSVIVAPTVLERTFSLPLARVMKTLSACFTLMAAQVVLLMLTPLRISRILSLLSASMIPELLSSLPERI